MMRQLREMKCVRLLSSSSLFLLLLQLVLVVQVPVTESWTTTPTTTTTTRTTTTRRSGVISAAAPAAWRRQQERQRPGCFIMTSRSSSSSSLYMNQQQPPNDDDKDDKDKNDAFSEATTKRMISRERTATWLRQQEQQQQQPTSKDSMSSNAVAAVATITNDSSSSSAWQQHLLAVAAGTLWWYSYGTYALLQPALSPEVAGVAATAMDAPTAAATTAAAATVAAAVTTAAATTAVTWKTFAAVYTALCPVAVGTVLYQLARPRTLREAQYKVAAAVALTTPSHCILVLSEPTGAFATTIVSIAVVTAVLGAYLVHYIKAAADREDQDALLLQAQQLQEQQLLTSTPSTTASSTVVADQPTAAAAADADADAVIMNVNDQESENMKDNVVTMPASTTTTTTTTLSIWDTVLQYRPPKTGASDLNMAMQFTRSLVAFAVTLSAFEDVLQHSAMEVAAGGTMNWWNVISFTSVLLHTTVESIRTALFPGLDLDANRSFAIMEAVLYLIHMYASSVMSFNDFLGTGGVLDQLVASWLFGNATSKFISAVERLGKHTNFDQALGLSNLGIAANDLEQYLNTNSNDPGSMNDGLALATANGSSTTTTTTSSSSPSSS